MATLQELEDIAGQNRIGASLDELEAIAAETQAPQQAQPEQVLGQTLQFGPLDTGIPLPESLTAGLISAGRGLTTVGRGLGFVDPASELDNDASNKSPSASKADLMGPIATDAAPV